MIMDKRRYLLVLTGLFLIIIGVLSSRFIGKRGGQKESQKNTVVAKKSNNTTKKAISTSNPVNFVYYKENYVRQLPHDLGLKKYTSDLDNLKIVCHGPKCKRQVLTVNKTKVIRPVVKINTVNSDVIISKNNLKYLKNNTKIMGDLYIKDINFVKIPKNFSVIGNVYIINSEGVTFMGNNFIDGHIFIKGRGSVRALPYNMHLTGQIFI